GRLVEALLPAIARDLLGVLARLRPPGLAGTLDRAGGRAAVLAPALALGLRHSGDVTGRSTPPPGALPPGCGAPGRSRAGARRRGSARTRRAAPGRSAP